MNNHEEQTVAAREATWATPRVVEFLGISRQAVNKRLHARTLLGYREGRSTRFPTWQFDGATGGVVPEVADLLEALGDRVDPAVVAEWAVTPMPGRSSTPAEMLVDPASTAEVLRWAEGLGGGAGPAAADHTAAAGRSDIPQGLMFQRLRTEADEQGRDSQTAILLAASELFAQHGPAKVSLRSVAAAAGVPYSLIYRFFGTKEKLLAAVMEQLVSYGARSLPQESDVYAAIANTLDADSGQWARTVTWAMLDEIPPSRLFRPGLRSGGYQHQIEKLWESPYPPDLRDRYDPRVVASLVTLVIGTWSVLEPYLSVLLGEEAPASDDQQAQVIELLQLLVWSARPPSGEVGAGP